MKNEHLGLILVVGLVAVIYFMFRFSGSASNCSFTDALLGRCAGA